jgi:hypothetical protein
MTDHSQQPNDADDLGSVGGRKIADSPLDFGEATSEELGALQTHYRNIIASSKMEINKAEARLRRVELTIKEKSVEVG